MTVEDFVPKRGNPFSESELNLLFQLHPNHTSRLLKKESNNIEYKQTFRFSSFDSYARDFAAFANTKGGYFVFGVHDETRELVGLQDDTFDRLDPTKPTQRLNNLFSPEICWKSYLHTLNNKSFGLIYVYPSTNKPIIALKNGYRITEGQIFYRYNGLTETIRYAEIRQIMDDIRRTEQELWLRHMRRLATIGVDNAAVFSFDDGTAHAKSGAFIIDADLLSQIQFLREGEFVERIGAPAVKIVGEAKILTSGTIIQSTSRLSAKAITEIDVYEVFLGRQVPQSPKEYLRVICSSSSIYMPIYYFAYLAKLTIKNLRDFILDNPCTGRMKLLERISADPSHRRYYQLPKKEETTKQRTEFIDKIYTKEFDVKREYNKVERLFQGLQLLTHSQIDVDYLFPILHSLFKKYWQHQGMVRHEMRRAICHIDYLIYFPKVNQEDSDRTVN